MCSAKIRGGGCSFAKKARDFVVIVVMENLLDTKQREKA